MESNETHVMVLVKTHPEGEDEWYCPTCGRRFMLGPAPSTKKVVLESGNEYASHSGGKGGISMQIAEVTVAEAEDSTRLAPWVAWIDSVDFDNLWDRPLQ